MTVLAIGGRYYAYVPKGGVRVPFEDGRFFRDFATEQEAIDWLFGPDDGWPEDSSSPPVQCACGAGCTDGVCTAEEIGD